jgi:hypothetical protein
MALFFSKLENMAGSYKLMPIPDLLDRRNKGLIATLSFV